MRAQTHCMQLKIRAHVFTRNSNEQIEYWTENSDGFYFSFNLHWQDLFTYDESR